MAAEELLPGVFGAAEFADVARELLSDLFAASAEVASALLSDLYGEAASAEVTSALLSDFFEDAASAEVTNKIQRLTDEFNFFPKMTISQKWMTVMHVQRTKLSL